MLFTVLVAGVYIRKVYTDLPLCCRAHRPTRESEILAWLCLGCVDAMSGLGGLSVNEDGGREPCVPRHEYADVVPADSPLRGEKTYLHS